MVPHSEQQAEEEVEPLPKPRELLPFLFFLGFMCCVGAFFSPHLCPQGATRADVFTSRVCDAAGFSPACAELAGLDGVAAPPLQYIAFPKSSTAFPNFNNFRFVRFNPCLLSFCTEVGGITWNDMTILDPAALQALLRVFVCFGFVCFNIPKV